MSAVCFLELNRTQCKQELDNRKCKEYELMGHM